MGRLGKRRAMVYRPLVGRPGKRRAMVFRPLEGRPEKRRAVVFRPLEGRPANLEVTLLWQHLHEPARKSCGRGIAMDDVLVSDLVLTDEHGTVGLDESISNAAEMLLDLGRGILVVVGEGNKVKGIVTPNQVLAAVSAGADTATETCGDHMDADVMEVGLDDNVDDIIETMNERKPHAVVAVDANGEFAGYFSPNDYREALARIESKPAIKKLAQHE
jgi:CBS domain-containing protein